MTLRLPQAMVDEMVAHAVADLPNECCGIISGANGEAQQLYRTRNSEGSPFRYNIDAQDLLQVHKDLWAHDWDVLVIYHSHVASEAYPSPTDVRLAVMEGPGGEVERYPGAYYVLVSLKDRDAPSVRAFQIQGGEVTEQPIEAV
jgi:proteasome lid subunit RPN8/RPN11